MVTKWEKKNGTYVLFRFHEGHPHLLATRRKHHTLNSNGGVNSVNRMLFKSPTYNNIDPSKADRTMKEQVDGFENVGLANKI